VSKVKIEPTPGTTVARREVGIISDRSEDFSKGKVGKHTKLLEDNMWGKKIMLGRRCGPGFVGSNQRFFIIRS
jgi:hypothetical protein